MRNIDVDLGLVKRLLDLGIENMTYLEPDMIPGWGLYVLQGIERLLLAGDRDAMLALLRDSISDRLEKGHWE